eukprot:4404632-Amphidinium_carterae.1
MDSTLEMKAIIALLALGVTSNCAAGAKYDAKFVAALKDLDPSVDTFGENGDRIDTQAQKLAVKQKWLYCIEPFGSEVRNSSDKAISNSLYESAALSVDNKRANSKAIHLHRSKLFKSNMEKDILIAERPDGRSVGRSLCVCVCGTASLPNDVIVSSR